MNLCANTHSNLQKIMPSGRKNRKGYTLYDLIYYNSVRIVQMEDSLVNAEGEAWEGSRYGYKRANERTLEREREILHPGSVNSLVVSMHHSCAGKDT